MHPSASGPSSQFTTFLYKLFCTLSILPLHTTWIGPQKTIGHGMDGDTQHPSWA